MCTKDAYNPFKLKSLSVCFFVFALTCTDLVAEPAEQSQRIAGNWYQVEVLIFRYDTAFEATQEKWPKKIDRTFPSNLSILDNGETTAINESFSMLTPGQFSFSNYISELKRKKNIKTLYHVAWRQPRLDKSLSQPLLIQAGDITEDRQFELEGTIRISIKRYIHIETDLWLSSYQKEDTQLNDLWEFSESDAPYFLQENNTDHEISIAPISAPASGLLAPLTHEQQPFVTKYIARMQQVRRMNRDELHYLDHPLFGLLVRTVRYELPEEPHPEEEPALQTFSQLDGF